MIETQTEINASPSHVREVLLDFANYPEWQTSGLLRLLEPEDSSKTLPTLQPGDKIKCDVDGMKFTAEIKENSEKLLQWQGPPVMGLISGLHTFSFQFSSSGGTLFTHSEEFSGPISFLMSPLLLGRKMLGQYRRFNEELKIQAEK
ncbi:hypothetical protein N7478_002028 [Penicillium angulare]|uniref:uncharacterized protein n=1 Tax=Penicillium angulare TaxID=116970 RepID=UPI00253FF25D|nr:uncharacterized protein N7478_002028 [Penicillium angulare]KAJ5288998.1 hypothetical protein N7478_002028 [Penicillium angulare]